MRLSTTIAPITGLVVSRSGVTFMARILGQNGNLITAASISTIQYSVRDLTDGTTDTALTSAGTVSDMVFDNLQQNDGRWDVDSANEPGDDGRHGYNFRVTLGATLFNEFDVESDAPHKVTPHQYQVSFVFTPATGTAFHVPYRFTPIPTWV